ncbi:MAG: hypothetical protein ACP5M5_14105 [Acidibrevibacterium sp.]|uniref:hypothetical protein n=1 Tax=Acidibrevibacterium sp. TaxID=2606776 RepID=UPI003D0024FD
MQLGLGYTRDKSFARHGIGAKPGADALEIGRQTLGVILCRHQAQLAVNVADEAAIARRLAAKPTLDPARKFHRRVIEGDIEHGLGSPDLTEQCLDVAMPPAPSLFGLRRIDVRLIAQLCRPAVKKGIRQYF